MKASRKFVALVLLSLKSRTLTYANVTIQRDENENGEINLIPKRFDYAIGSPKQSKSLSLYDKAFQLTGDALFSRKLEEEELEEEQRSLEIKKSDRASSSFVLPTLTIVLALTKHGFATTFQETMRKSANLLLLAWLPVFSVNANWIEMLSVTLLLVRAPMYSFVVNDFFSDTLAILKKILLGELWRRFWEHATKNSPIPILSPSAEYLELTPDWFQTGWARVNKVVDKHVQGLLRKSFERSFQEFLGVAVDALLESLPKAGQLSQELDHHEASMNSP